MAALFPWSMTTEKEQPNQKQQRAHNWDRVFEDERKEARCVNLLTVRDRFDHKVRSIADVSIRSEKYRANANRQKVAIQRWITQQSGKVNVLPAGGCSLWRCKKAQCGAQESQIRRGIVQ